MDHTQAIKQMTAERYLLNELAPEERDAYEEHVFECTECAMDLRAGAAFVDEAKVQLPGLLAVLPDSPPAKTSRRRREGKGWFSWMRTEPMRTEWMRPAYAVPLFAALLLIVGYQNVVTFPSLRASANQPQLLASIPLHGATRGGEHLSINADHKHGIVLPFEFFRQPGAPLYATYSFVLTDSQGKLDWTGTIAAPDDSVDGDQRISLVIPGAMMQNGSYTVTIYGVGSQGERAEIQKQAFDLHLTE
jgi:hypothetical protein